MMPQHTLQDEEYDGRRTGLGRITGASFVYQYPITLVHIVGFKIIKIEPIYCRYWGDEGFKVGLGRVVYKD